MGNLSLNTLMDFMLPKKEKCILFFIERAYLLVMIYSLGYLKLGAGTLNNNKIKR